MADDKLIRNCELRFAFDCPTRWSALKPSDAATLRRCQVCSKNVRACETSKDVESASKAGERVATSSDAPPEWSNDPPPVSLAQLRKAQAAQQKDGRRIGYALIKSGAIEESQLTDFLSKQYGVPAINLKEFAIAPEVIKLVPRELAMKHNLIPVKLAGKTLIIAMSDPSNVFGIDDVKLLTGFHIEVVVAAAVAVTDAIERYYPSR